MTRIFRITAQIVALLTFIAGSTIAGLDTFGALDGVPALRDAVPKFSLLLVGLLGSTLVIEHWVSIMRIERDSRTAATASQNIDGILKNVYQLTHPTRLITNRHDHYQSFFQALSSIPPRAIVNVTHCEKLMGAPYDIGENESEALLMRRWKELIHGGDIEVRQIVHVSSLHDLSEVEGRLREFENCLNFSLNVSCNPPSFPYLDLVVIKDHWAALDISSDAVEPFRAALAMEFRGHEFLDSLGSYFDIWWTRFSVPIKSKDGINQERLYRLHRLLPAVDRHGNTELYSDLAFIAEREPSIHHFANSLIAAATRLHVPAIYEVYRSSFQKTLTDTATTLSKLAQEDMLVDRSLVEQLLIDTANYAHARILAVSYDTDQESFWVSPFGLRLLDVNRQAVRRGVKFQRVFLLTKGQLPRDSTLRILKDHRRAGIEVYYADADMVDPSLRHDFLLMDNEFVFEMDVAGGDSPVKSGTLHTSPTALSSYNTTFTNLLLKSQRFDDNRRKL